MGSSFPNSPTEASSRIKEVPPHMYYLAGTSEEPPQAILKGLNVCNGFAWFDELIKQPS